MTKKRVLAALLALCLLVGMLPLAAGATGETPDGDGETTPPAGEKKVLTVKEGPIKYVQIGGGDPSQSDFSPQKDYDGTDVASCMYPEPLIGNVELQCSFSFVTAGENGKEEYASLYGYTVTAKYADKNVGKNKTVTYTITLSDEEYKEFCFADGAQSTTATGKGDIMPLTLSLKDIAATNRKYEKGKKIVTLASAKLISPIQGDDVKLDPSVAGEVGDLATVNAQTKFVSANGAAGTYNRVIITPSSDTSGLSGADAGNYILSIATRGDLLVNPVTIEPADRTITAAIAKEALDSNETTKVTVSADNATDEEDFAGKGNKYTYASSNTAVATVDAAGNVTAKGAGTAKITVSAPATKNFAAGTKEVDVSVKSPASLKLNATVVDGDTGENPTKVATLTVVGAPEDATVTVTCDVAGVALAEQGNGTWTATLTDLEKEYTFTVETTPTSAYMAGKASCKVKADGTTVHVHTWATAWSSDANGHWHNCTAADCTESDNTKKDGYAAHTPGEWVIDQAATATVAGSRHRVCSVCEYTETESIPATGGNSGNQGNSGGGTTTPSTPTPKDEVTTTPTVSGGTASTTVSSSDGASLVEAAKQPGTGEVTVKVEPTQDVTAANVTLPASTVSGVGAAKSDLTVSTPVADITLPSETLTGLGTGASNVTVSAAVNSDETVSITVRKDNTTVTALAQPMRASIPAENVTGSTVAVLVDENGKETIIPKSISGKDEISLLLGGSGKIKLKDNAKTFNDTQGHWAANDGSIGFATSRELFQGTSDTSFSPETTMTRGMMVTVLHRLESTPKGGSVSFGDVSADAYFAEAVAWGNANDIVKGDGSNFLPNDNVTREQLATFLYRYAGKYGVDTAGRTNLTSFPDSGNVSGYAKDALEWAYHTGLIKGGSDGKLNPTGSAKRGEVAAILMRFVEYINK